MGDRTQYTPGTFCWTDLTTTDQDAAKSFYGALFGWELIDNPVGDGVYYTMAQLDAKPVGAISSQPEQQREAGHGRPGFGGRVHDGGDLERTDLASLHAARAQIAASSCCSSRRSVR